MKKNKKEKHNILPLILVILDGWGLNRPNKGNPICIADTPTMDGVTKKYLSTAIFAHSKHAGLPLGQVGNSEAGHMNIGAGRVVVQDSVKITNAIKNGTFLKNPAFLGAVRHVKKYSSNLHIIGLLSDGQSPHSDPKHFEALIELAKKNDIENVYIHFFTDGRDSPKYAASKLLSEFKQKYPKQKICTVMGRFWGMDRKKKWSRTESAYNALVLGKGRKAESSQDAILEGYNRGEDDEFLEPYVIYNDKKIAVRIKDFDSVIFFNLRSDRARQLAKAFVQKDFKTRNKGSFKRKKTLKHLYFVSMTDFGPGLDDIITAFPSLDLKETLPMQLKKLKQLYIAETEKYAHVTYFFNGGYSKSIANEDQHMISSPDVKSYDETPAMSSAKLTRYVVNSIKNKKYDFVLLNFAAPDMIGHTGNLEAGIDCCGEIDKNLGKIIKEYLRANGTVVITADHGNIEEMVNLKTDEVITEHSVNKVPFIIVNKDMKEKIKLKRKGNLGDVAPTILDLLGYKKPKEMSGKSLIIKI